MRTKDVFLVLIMNLAFGATFISAKVGVTEFPAFMFTALRFLIVAVVLIPFLKIHKGQMFNILIISILGGGIHFGLFYLALDSSKYVSSVAIVLQLGIPISTLKNYFSKRNYTMEKNIRNNTIFCWSYHINV